MQKEEKVQLMQIEKKITKDDLVVNKSSSKIYFLIKILGTVFFIYCILGAYFVIMVSIFFSDASSEEMFFVFNVLIVLLCLPLLFFYKNIYMRTILWLIIISSLNAVLLVIIFRGVSFDNRISFLPFDIDFFLFVIHFFLLPAIIILLYNAIYIFLSNRYFSLQVEKSKRKGEDCTQKVLQIVAKKEKRNAKIKQNLSALYVVLKGANIFLLFASISVLFETRYKLPEILLYFKINFLGDFIDEKSLYFILMWLWAVFSLFFYKDKYVRIFVTALTYFYGVTFVLEIPLVESIVSYTAKILTYSVVLSAIYLFITPVATFLLYKLYFKLIPKAYHAIFKKKASKFRIE